MGKEQNQVVWEDERRDLYSQSIKLENGCMIYDCKTGVTRKNGYHEKYWWYVKTTISVHRRSYIIKNNGNPIPSEINGECVHIRHTCDQPLCVNPCHLVQGTARENMRDKKRKLSRGESIYSNHLTDEIVKQIRETLFLKDEVGYMSKKMRGEKFGLHRKTIADIDNGIVWGHVPGKRSLSDMEAEIKRNHRSDRIQKQRKLNKKKILTSEEFNSAGEILYSRIDIRFDNKKVSSVPGDCWEYTMYKDPEGYGYFHCHGKQGPAHVWSLEIYNKCHSPPGKEVSHLCGNPSCIRASHLRYCTHGENMGDTSDFSVGTKITPDQVRYIRTCGKPTVDLAALLGVHVSSISTIKTRKSRKYVSDDGPIWAPGG